METTYAYLISLYDTMEPRGIFLTEEEALAAAERYVSAYWKEREEELKTFGLSKEAQEAGMQYIQDEKERWKDCKLIEDVIYIHQVPLNKIVLYNGKEY
jgi:hypothetical protein